jgi:hypothetical protein
MTMPKAGAAQQRLQRYLDQKQQLEAKIRRERAKQQAQIRRERDRRWHRYGALVARAGLDPVDPAILLGLLLAGATRLSDPATQHRWHTAGQQVLEAQSGSSGHGVRHPEDGAPPAPPHAQGWSPRPSPGRHETVGDRVRASLDGQW